MEPFKAGDVVQLKSGGPKMTIKNVGRYGLAPTTDTALCVWFDGLKPMEKAFELATLDLATPDTVRRVVVNL